MAAIGGLGLALGLTFPAESLTPDEAGRVAALLVDLGPELGPFAYDGEEAGRIFEEDEAYGARIAAAGFSRESWTNAFDELFRGYLATIPNDAFSERLTQALAGLEAMSHLTEEQRAELMPLFEEKIAEIQLLRAEGARHADVVRPHAAILETVFGTDLVPAE
jgi:hypothetical protein